MDGEEHVEGEERESCDHPQCILNREQTQWMLDQVREGSIPGVEKYIEMAAEELGIPEDDAWVVWRAMMLMLENLSEHVAIATLHAVSTSHFANPN